MDQKPAPSSTPKELPPDKAAQQSLRRGLLLAALGGILIPCLYCWYTYRVGTAEEGFLPGLALLLAIIHSTAFFLRHRARPPFPLLVSALLASCWGIFLWLVIRTLVRVSGWQAFATLAALLLGAWGAFLALWGVFDSITFLTRSEVIEANQAQLIYLPHPEHPEVPPPPVLVYRYLGSFQGRHSSAWLRLRSRGISQAQVEGRLQVRVRFLPQDPKIHRFLGWKLKSKNQSMQIQETDSDERQSHFYPDHDQPGSRTAFRRLPGA